MATTARSDPIRNFKFNVQVVDSELGTEIAKMGFTNVDGINMTTDMLPYREGGFNTTPHKLPGQTDFGPLSMSSGVFWDKQGMWKLAKRMFAVQYGGTLGMTAGQPEEYRYTIILRIMAHPVTRGAEANPPGSRSDSGALVAFKFINCWTASVGFGGVSAQDNGILIHQMQVHHEGFDVIFGNINASREV